MLAESLPEDIAAIMKKHIALYGRPLRWQQGVSGLIDTVKNTVYKDKPIPDNVQVLFRHGEQLTEAAVNDIIEDLYSTEEGMLSVFLEDLKQGNRSFYDRPHVVKDRTFRDSKQAFLYAVSSQHYRTKGVYNRWKVGFGIVDEKMLDALGINKSNIRPENIAYQVFLHVEGQVVDYLEAIGAKLTVLVNDTAVPFLTSDQPVVNLKAVYKSITEQVSGIVFYYPITPQLAILIGSECTKTKHAVTTLEVDKYNSAIIAASNEFVFADTDSALERYI